MSKAREKTEEWYDQAGELMGKARDKTGELYEQAGEMMDKAMERASEMATKAKTEKIHHQTLAGSARTESPDASSPQEDSSANRKADLLDTSDRATEKQKRL